MDARVQRELERRKLHTPKTLSQIEQALDLLGYALDRSCDVTDMATNLNTGDSYPCTTTGIIHKETGLSFAHIDAPHGIEFLILQSMRFSGWWCAVVNDTLFDL